MPIPRFLPIFGSLALGLSLLIHPARAQSPAAPAGASEEEPLSARFQVSVEQAGVPVYLARICSASVEQRQNMGLPIEKTTSTTSFASFNMTEQAHVAITCTEAVNSVKVLPGSSGAAAEISGNTIALTVAKPGPLTIEVNGDWVHSLHLFANPMETDVPSPGDPNVIYYGPGVHHLQNVQVPSGKTVYIADGAVIYGHSEGANPGSPIFCLQGSHITLRGRGIIDGSLCPRGTPALPGRSIVGVYGSDIRVEGVILRDSGGFTLPVRRSDRVQIDNVKVFGWRGNSDGMDICNSRQVEVSHCFLRTFDDLVVLKTDKGQGELRDVTVKNCVLWNEFAHALSLGAELREPLSNILFSDCDVIHDKGREWLLRIFNADSAPVKGVVFDNIRIEEARRLMSVWIGQAVWSKETERGHIDDVTFKNINSVAPTRPGPLAELIGFDATHTITGVQFQDVVVNGHAFQESTIHQNAFVNDVAISP